MSPDWTLNDTEIKEFEEIDSRVWDFVTILPCP